MEAPVLRDRRSLQMCCPRRMSRSPTSGYRSLRCLRMHQATIFRQQYHLAKSASAIDADADIQIPRHTLSTYFEAQARWQVFPRTIVHCDRTTSSDTGVHSPPGHWTSIGEDAVKGSTDDKLKQVPVTLSRTLWLACITSV
jgi:hypothetical protein